MEGLVVVSTGCGRRDRCRVLVVVLALCLAAVCGVASAMDDGLPNRQFGFGEVKSVAFSPDGEKLLVGGLNAVLIDAESGEHVVTFFGHTVTVKSAVYSSDGKMVLSCAEDFTTRLWDAEMGKLLRVVPYISSARSTAVAFSNDNTNFAVGYDSGEVKIWDIATGNELLTFNDSSTDINSLCFSPDGKYLVAGSQTVLVWDLDTGEFDREIWPETSGVSCVYFSPDGSVLFSGSKGYYGRLWDFNSDELLHQIYYHGDITSGSFSPDGAKIVVGGTRTLGAELWDVESGEKIKTFSIEHNDIYSVDYSPDGSQVVTGLQKGGVVVWDVESGESVNQFLSIFRDVNTVSFSPDDTTVLTGGDDTIARLWNANTAVVIREFVGHFGEINDASFSPDGSQFVTGSSDDTAKLWDIVTGTEVRTFTGHTGDVVSVSFSPDGSLIYTASADMTVIEWDVNTGNISRTFNGHVGEITDMSLSPDGTMMVTGSSDATAKILDLSSGDVVQTVSPGMGPVFSVDFSPDGKTILTGSQHVPVKSWDVITGEHLVSYFGVNATTGSIKYSPDGSKVYAMYGGLIYVYSSQTGERIYNRNYNNVINDAFSWSSDGNSLLIGSCYGGAVMWDPLILFEDNVEELPQYRRIGSGYIYDAAFSPDGTRLLLGGAAARVLDIETGELVSQVEVPTKWAREVCFSPDGDQYLAARGVDLQLFDTETGDVIRDFSGHSRSIYDLDFSSDGSKILSGGGDATAILWDRMTGEAIYEFAGYEQIIYSVDISPDDSMALTAEYGGIVRLWSLSTGQEIRSYTVDDDELSTVVAVEFSPDGAQFITAVRNYQEADRNLARIWDVDTGNSVQTFDGHDDRVSYVTFSHDGTKVLTGGTDKKAILWNVDSGEVLNTYSGFTSTVGSVEFSFDDRELLAGTSYEVKVINIEKDEEVFAIQSESRGVLSVAVSPDERLVLSGEGDQSARIWDVQTGELLQTLVGHEDRVRSVCFSHDGQYALTGSGAYVYSSSPDGSVKLWSVERGELLRTYLGHSTGSVKVSFSPDDALIFSGSVDGSAILWNRDTGEQIHQFNLSARIISVAYSNDGNYIAAGCNDSTVVIWNPINGERVQTVHTGCDIISSISISPDGKTLATSHHETFFSTGGGYGVRLWSLDTGELIRVIDGRSCSSVVFLPDGNKVFAIFDDYIARVLDIESGNIQQAYPVSNWSDPITTTPNTGKVVTGSGNGIILIWDLLLPATYSGMKLY